MPGAFVDIVYDHFLANDPTNLKKENWLNLHKILIDSWSHFKMDSRKNSGMFFYYMRTQNWL